MSSFLLIIYMEGKGTEDGRKDRLTTGSLHKWTPTARAGMGQRQEEPGTACGAPNWRQRPSTWTISCFLPGHKSRKSRWKLRGQDSKVFSDKGCQHGKHWHNLLPHNISLSFFNFLGISFLLVSTSKFTTNLCSNCTDFIEIL